ncbi:hypothetical protein D3C76_1479150 [compost metagenome]
MPKNSSKPWLVGRYSSLSPKWFLPNCPVAYPWVFSAWAMVTSLACSPTGTPGMPTLDRPVRRGVCPVMNDDRPAVQLFSA